MRKLMILMLVLSLGALAEPTLNLAKVTSFDSRATGYGGTESSNYKAFRSELERGAQAAPLFAELLANGSPEARLYSALGLYHLDKSRGVAALENLRTDSSPLRTLSGCLGFQSTVGATARGLLKNDGQAIAAYLPRGE